MVVAWYLVVLSAHDSMRYGAMREGDSRIVRPCFDAGCAHWNDTDGNRIEAHSAGMLQSPLDERWYWYGESKKTGSLKDHGVNVYSAPDISGPWRNEGWCSALPRLQWPCIPPGGD
jgi:hypothetical protein